MLLGEFFNDFKAGSELAHAETWKKAQVLVNALVVLFTAGVAISGSFGYKIDISSDGVQSIAAGVATLVGLFNGGITVATTTRIGLQDKTRNARIDGTDGVANRGVEGRTGVDSDVHSEVSTPVKSEDIFNNRSLG